MIFFFLIFLEKPQTFPKVLQECSLVASAAACSTHALLSRLSGDERRGRACREGKGFRRQREPPFALSSGKIRAVIMALFKRKKRKENGSLTQQELPHPSIPRTLAAKSGWK